MLVSLFILLLAGTEPAAPPAADATPPAGASVQAQGAPSETAKPKKKKAKRVCYDETPTGSFINKQRCISVEQAEDERVGAERFQQRAADTDLKTVR